MKIRLSLMTTVFAYQLWQIGLKSGQFLDAIHRPLNLLPPRSVFVGDGRDELFLAVRQMRVGGDVFECGNRGGDITFAKRVDNGGNITLGSFQGGKVFLHDEGRGEISDLLGQVKLLGRELGGLHNLGKLKCGTQCGGILSAS